MKDLWKCDKATRSTVLKKIGFLEDAIQKHQDTIDQWSSVVEHHKNEMEVRKKELDNLLKEYKLTP